MNNAYKRLTYNQIAAKIHEVLLPSVCPKEFKKRDNFHGEDSRKLALFCVGASWYSFNGVKSTLSSRVKHLASILIQPYTDDDVVGSVVKRHFNVIWYCEEDKEIINLGWSFAEGLTKNGGADSLEEFKRVL